MLLRIGAVVVAVVAILTVSFVLRGTATTVVADVTDARVSVECTGWTGVSTGCADWGAAVLAAGAPSSTFEMGDVTRLVLDRESFGFASGCQARYFLSRYPDEPAWTEPIACSS